MELTAAECKHQTDEQVAKLRAQAAELAGKEFHKDRASKGKAIAELRAQPRYIDACRVIKGFAPAFGFFASQHRAGAEDAESPGPLLTVEVAARLAAEAEAALAELEPVHTEKRAMPEPGIPGGRPEDADVLIQAWSQRTAKLEATMAEPLEVPPEGTDSINELEAIAIEIVDYRNKLKEKCGYRNKDFKEFRELQKVEDRLDTLAGALLPEQSFPVLDVDAEGDELREWEQRLISKLTHHQKTHSSIGLSPSATKEVERLLSEVAERKVKLRAEGLSEHEQDKDQQVLLRLVRLAELRQWSHHDMKHDKRDKPELSVIRKDVHNLHEKFETHKRRLREDRGLSHKDVKHDPEICELDERLTILRKLVGGA